MAKFWSNSAFALVMAMALAVPVLAGCSVNPATGEQNFTAFMSPADELQVGKEEHPKILVQHGGNYDDASLSQYIDRIGQVLAKTSETPNLTFTFTVLNDDVVNAFALPGGYVYITRGLLALAQNEAEVAGVLAHEIGHVVARHTAQRYSQSVAVGIGATILGAVSGSQGIANVAGLGSQLYLQSFSREQELQADELGVRYMTRAGYDPDAMTSFFEKLRLQDALQAKLTDSKRNPDAVDMMATHPRTVDRIRHAAHLAASSRPANARLDRDRFLQQIDGIIYGDDPKEGLIRGQEFIHPELGIRFEAPDGFRLVNGPTQVAARGPDGSLIIFDMELKLAASERSRIDLRQYLDNVWGKSLNLTAIERINVNGLEAATGTARVTLNSGARDVRLLAIRINPDRIFRFAFLTPPNLTNALSAEFRRTTYSFRPISRREAANLRPLRLRITTAGPRDTVDSLADTLPYPDFREDRFRVLNGLEPNQPLQPGQKVKLVTE